MMLQEDENKQMIYADLCMHPPINVAGELRCDATEDEAPAYQRLQ